MHESVIKMEHHGPLASSQVSTASNIEEMRD